MTDRKPDIPDINKIKCEDCRYSVDNVIEERPKMRFCAISGHALDIMDKGLPIWGCPIKDAYMQKKGRKRRMRYIDHIRNMSDDQLAYFLNANTRDVER